MADPPGTTDPRSKRPEEREAEPPLAGDDPVEPPGPRRPAPPYTRRAVPPPSSYPDARPPPSTSPYGQPIPAVSRSVPTTGAANDLASAAEFESYQRAERERLIADVAKAVQLQSPPPKPTARWTDNMGIIIGCLAVLTSAGTIFGTTYSLRGEVSEVKTSVEYLKERSKILDETAKAVTDLRLESLKADSAMQLQLVQIATKLDDIIARLNRLDTRRP